MRVLVRRTDRSFRRPLEDMFARSSNPMRPRERKKTYGLPSWAWDKRSSHSKVNSTAFPVVTRRSCLQTKRLSSRLEFPLQRQYALARVSLLEEFERGRVILREGHRAEKFYLIVDGVSE